MFRHFRRLARHPQRAGAGYVTQSNSSSARILNGPVHPLTPPDPPPPGIVLTPDTASPTPTHRHAPQQPPQMTVKHHFEQKHLRITVTALGISNLTIPYLWLRDACQEPHSVHPHTKQKLFKTTDIPLDIHPTKTTLINNDAASALEPEIELKWSHSIINQSPPESSRFKLSFLRQFDQPSEWENRRHKASHLTPTLWYTKPHRSQGKKTDPKNKIDELQDKGELFLDYTHFRHDTKIQKLALERLNSLGLVFFDNLNVSPQASRDEQTHNQTELLRLIQSCLHLDIRRTFYGDLWDVVSRGEDAKNVANTNLALDYHMDLVHFENPPRFQFLHFLKNDVDGGRSGFLDAYSVVAQLLLSQPEAFRTLASVPVGFEYMNDNHHTYFRHATIELKPQTSIDRLMRRPHELLDALVAVNYSPPFQAPLTLPHHPYNPQHNPSNHPDTLHKLVKSLNAFVSLFDRHRYAFEIAMKPGQAVAFDNRRVLHSRTAFSPKPHHINPVNANTHDASVYRWLKGAYVDGDSVWDRIRVLNS
ncbi:hypothetical protein PCANC_06342 [Puccinia coronata f. sp. avenae]|uniref:TauD/TfdA-like domain-containing protein n=1 Tax=Puccinia coronata f. sp. avenae TaxID=200324 RepID=A0A2N5S843_9BASI|nr:hypothetical protein PCASD_22927 [Puccinia coronata f. sp. avenae]PLW19397.1 hypothetical protein PCANC_06342 [Puccinia coronata f. sp. avenae]PLW46720.1 hypothetical protein PCASD_03656 [Puccinia coronata f. sp. avenae]